MIEDRVSTLFVGDREELWRPCGDAIVQTFATHGTFRAALCGDGGLVVERRGGQHRVATPLVSPQREFVAMALRVDGAEPEPRGAAWVGSTLGVIREVDLLTGRVTRALQGETRRMIHRIEASPDRRAALVDFEGAPLVHVDLDALSLVGTLPAKVRPGRWLDDQRYATFGERLEVWSLERGPPASADAGGRVSGLTLTDDVVAVARDNGAELVEPRTGRSLWRHDWGLGVTKAIVPRGDVLLVGTSADPPGGDLRMSLDDGRFVTTMFPVRRMLALPDGGILRSFATPGLDLFRGRGDVERLDERHVHDLAALGHFVAVLETRPRAISLWSFETGASALTRCETPGAIALALGPGGRSGLTVFVLDPTSVVAMDPFECAIEVRLGAPESELWKVAATPDGALIAAGTLSGEVVVWRRDGSLLAEVKRHEEAVTALTTDRQGTFFLSGSWDGRLGFIDVATLLAPGNELAAATRRAWGR